MDTLEAIRIDLADYEYAGEGANGVSYNHRWCLRPVFRRRNREIT